MGDLDVRRRAAWRFVRAMIRSQASGVVGAALSGLLWQAGAVAAPLMVKYAIDRGVLTKDSHALLIWLAALLGVGLLEMTAGAARHLYAIRNRARSDGASATRTSRTHCVSMRATTIASGPAS